MERLVDTGRQLEYRENMRQAPAAQDRHPKEQPASCHGIDLAGPLLVRLLEETEEDVECDIEDMGSDPLLAANNGLLSSPSLEPVVLSPDGKSIIVTPSVSALDELDLTNLFLDDPQHALDSEDIIPYLPENTPLPPPPSRQPPSVFQYDSDTPEEPFFHSDMSIASSSSPRADQNFDLSDEVIPDSEPPESLSDASPTSGSHASINTEDSRRVNFIVTTFQQLLINEDERERLICRLLDEGVLLSQLQQHMTPYIRDRLQAQAECSQPPGPVAKISISSPFRLSSHEPDLLPFDKQRKEKRHESRGCR